MTGDQKTKHAQTQSVQLAQERAGSTLTNTLQSGATFWGPVMEKIREWTPAEPLPTSLTEASVSTAISALSEALEPGGPEPIEVVVKRMLVLHEALAMKMDDGQLKAMATLYRASLGDIPGNVLLHAFSAVAKGWRYRNLPTPGDIRREADAIMEGWRLAKMRLETARAMMCRKPPRRETIAEVNERRAQRARRIDEMVARQSSTGKNQ